METIEELSAETIKQLSWEWLREKEETSYLESALMSKLLTPYFNQLKDHKVIEIGPGKNPVINHFPCKEYIGVYAHGRKEFVPEDGLTFLRECEDNSAVVVSFGVIDDDVLGSGEERGIWEVKRKLCNEYVKELAREIKRVMSPFSIIIGNDVGKYLGKSDVLLVNGEIWKSHWENMGGVYIKRELGTSTPKGL